MNFNQTYGGHHFGGGSCPPTIFEGGPLFKFMAISAAQMVLRVVVALQMQASREFMFNGSLYWLVRQPWNWRPSSALGDAAGPSRGLGKDLRRAGWAASSRVCAGELA